MRSGRSTRSAVPGSTAATSQSATVPTNPSPVRSMGEGRVGATTVARRRPSVRARGALAPTLPSPTCGGGGICLRGSSDRERLEGLGREQLLDRESLGRQALLVVIAREGFEDLAVGLEAVGPEILAHLALGLLDVGEQPRQHDLERGGLLEFLI